MPIQPLPLLFIITAPKPWNLRSLKLIPKKQMQQMALRMLKMKLKIQNPIQSQKLIGEQRENCAGLEITINLERQKKHLF